jgi:putative MATE family efflux protein
MWIYHFRNFLRSKEMESCNMSEQPKQYLFSNQALFKLIFPLFIEQLLAVAVGLADSLMVASVGEAAVSAVSLVDNINVLLINVFSALATGGAVVAGQFIGHGDTKKAARSGEQLVVFVTLISLVVMVIMYLGKPFILHVVFGKIEPDVMDYADRYLMIVNASIPFLALYNSGAALFRAQGNSKVSMKTSLLMNGINIVGNAILVFGFRFGVEGVAIPTLVSRMTAAIVIILLLRNQELAIHISKPFHYRFDGKMVKRILGIGIPNGIENSMFQLGKIVLLSLISTFGTTAIAANAVSNTIAGIEILPGQAIGLAMTTVVSQCVGADDFVQVRYYTKKLMKYAISAMAVLNILILILLPFLMNIYHLSAETTRVTEQILLLHGIMAIFIWPFSFTLPSTLRAASDVRFTMFVGICSMWFCRIILGFFFGKTLGLGVFGTWVAMIVDWCVRSIFFVKRYLGNKWTNHSITF